MRFIRLALGLGLSFLMGNVGGTARAALMGSYTFESTGTQNITWYSSFGSKLSASAFANSQNGTGNGINGSQAAGNAGGGSATNPFNAWNTANNITNSTYDTTKVNTFSFQKANTFASTDVVKITGLKFDLARGNGSPVSGNITANSIDVQVEYRVNSGSWSLLGSGSTGVRPQVAASGSTVANTFGTVDLQFLTPVFFNSQTSDSLEFRMAWKRTFTTSSGGTATSRGWVDNVSLYGDAFAVPEPSSIAVFGLLVSGLALRRRK